MLNLGFLLMDDCDPSFWLVINRVESNSNSSFVLLKPSVEKHSGCIHLRFALNWFDILLFQSFETKTTESYIKMRELDDNWQQKNGSLKSVKESRSMLSKATLELYLCVPVNSRRETVSVML